MRPKGYGGSSPSLTVEKRVVDREQYNRLNLLPDVLRLSKATDEMTSYRKVGAIWQKRPAWIGGRVVEGSSLEN